MESVDSASSMYEAAVRRRSCARNWNDTRLCNGRRSLFGAVSHTDVTVVRKRVSVVSVLRTPASLEDFDNHRCQRHGAGPRSSMIQQAWSTSRSANRRLASALTPGVSVTALQSHRAAVQSTDRGLRATGRGPNSLLAHQSAAKDRCSFSNKGSRSYLDLDGFDSRETLPSLDDTSSSNAGYWLLEFSTTSGSCRCFRTNYLSISHQLR